MNDEKPSTANERIAKIKVADFAALGKQIVEWANNPDNRPKNISEAKSILTSVGVEFPESRLPDDAPIFFIDTPLNAWVIKLPQPEIINETLREITEGEKGLYASGDLPEYLNFDNVDEQNFDLDFYYAMIGHYSVDPNS